MFLIVVLSGFIFWWFQSQDATSDQPFLPEAEILIPQTVDNNDPATNKVNQQNIAVATITEFDFLPDNEAKDDEEEIKEGDRSDSIVTPDFKVSFPQDRIIAFYGNFYSRFMGILGEFPEDEVLRRLNQEISNWQTADPNTNYIPAVHYIASTAQVDPTTSGTYSLQMPDSHILQAIAMGLKAGGITFLDLQIGQADLMNQVRRLDRYLRLPNVHLGIDPEFAMSTGLVPGEKIGTLDAGDINEVINYLSEIVQADNLPPKLLVVHRFTQQMVTNISDIQQKDNVITIINMDGWGSPELKLATYRNIISLDQVPYAGFKIFYKNDLKPPSTRLLQPAELINLTPVPVYIQYQ